MAKLETIFSRFQVRYRRSSNVTKIVVTVSIVLCMVALISLRVSMNDLESRTENLRSRAVALEQANSDLQEHIANLGTVQSVVDIAQEQLGLVQPGTVIFQPES